MASIELFEVRRRRNARASRGLFEHRQDARPPGIGRDRDAALADPLHLAVDQEVESAPERLQCLVDAACREPVQIQRIVDHRTVSGKNAIELIVDEVRNLNRVDVAELVARHQIDHDTLRGLALPALLRSNEHCRF